jgi:Ca-activated chloride channel family protein
MGPLHRTDRFQAERVPFEDRSQARRESPPDGHASTNVDLVYPLEDTVFPGSVQTWVGQFKTPGQATFRVEQMTANATLPAQNTDHPHLPRAWAKARVDALLEKSIATARIKASIDEIIRLSRLYKFVTPYTSFLAAPRALLRPRLIRPGDPVLRVKTDESITSCRRDVSVWSGEDAALSERRGHLADALPGAQGSGRRHLSRASHLRDKQGRVFRESKSFVIASKPPTVK